MGIASPSGERLRVPSGFFPVLRPSVGKTIPWPIALIALAAAACAGPRKVSLMDLSSDLEIRSLPTGAGVVDHGELLGHTPLTLPLAGGKSYELLFSMPGFAARSVSGTRESLMALAGGTLGVVLLPVGTKARPPGFDDVAGLTAVAQALERRGDWGGAAQFWDRVITVAPRDARAHRGMGSAFAKLGRDEEAVREYEQYLFLAPDAPDAVRVRRAVDSFRGGIELPSADADLK